MKQRSHRYDGMLRRDESWLAGLDQCIARASDLDINVPMSEDLGGNKGFDERILHSPVL
jgi:hypothetical protein